MPEDTTKTTKSVGSLPHTDPPTEKKGILRSLSFQFTPFYGTRRHRTGNSVHTYDSTPEESPLNSSNLGPIQGVQCQGILMKKCSSKTRVKWNRRFFVLKECFLLYYGAKQKKRYDKHKKIDMHPRVRLL